MVVKKKKKIQSDFGSYTQMVPVAALIGPVSMAAGQPQLEYWLHWVMPYRCG